MNPPFTSSRRMSQTYKDDLKRRFRANPRYASLVKGNIGYHLYFICIADKFLTSNGRMAVVMPFTTLIGGDFSELTRFLVSKYSIEYIVIGQGRSAFSENTMFSEMLFVAKKKIPTDSHNSVLLLTKTSPTSWSVADVESIAHTAQKCAATGKRLETNLCIATSFNQRELLPEGKTLTRLVANLDKRYKVAGDELHRIIEHSGLTTTFAHLEEAQLLKLKVAEVVHGRSRTSKGHSLTRFGGDALVACRTEERALMKHDRLIYKDKTKESFHFRDKGTGDVFVVPKDVVTAALRRFAYVNRFELTGHGDFVIIKPFTGDKKLFYAILGEEKARTALEAFRAEWPQVVESGSSRICLPGRIDLTAPGSKLLAVRSNRPIFMCSFMWGITGLARADEKIIVLWLNSAIFFYLLLARITVTRGSWVKLHGKPLRKMQVLDLTKLSDSAKTQLISLYDELSNFKWSSLIDQYTAPSKERKRLDMEMLKVLGVDDPNKAHKVLCLIYNAIIASLRAKQNTMGAD